MNINFKILFLIILMNMISYSQKCIIGYEKIKVENISSIEARFNSTVKKSKLETIESTKDSLIHYGKLVNYFRQKTETFDATKVIYHYLKKDSLVRRIDYYWISKKNSSISDFSNQFDITVENISLDIGKPFLEKSKLTKIFYEGLGKSYERKVTWKYKEATILTIMIWSKNRGAYLMTTIKWDN